MLAARPPLSAHDSRTSLSFRSSAFSSRITASRPSTARCVNPHRSITTMSATYGFLGLGIMGVPMCRNLLKSGAKVVIWNRTPDTVSRLASATL